MINESSLIDHILKLKESSFDYNISCIKDELVMLNKIIIEILIKNKTCIVKGSKQKILKKTTDIKELYKDKVFIKKDYDIITSNPYKFINKLIKYINKYKLSKLKINVINNYYFEIFQISVNGIPYIDLDYKTKKVYQQVPFSIKHDIQVVDDTYHLLTYYAQISNFSYYYLMFNFVKANLKLYNMIRANSNKSLNIKSLDNKSLNNKSVNNKSLNNKSFNNKLLNNKSLSNILKENFNILHDNTDIINNNHIITGDIAYKLLTNDASNFNYSNSDKQIGGNVKIQVLEIVTKTAFTSSLIQSILKKFDKYKSKIERNENILFQNNLNVIKVSIYTEQVKLQFMIYNIIYDIPYIQLSVGQSKLYISDIPFILYLYSYKLLLLQNKYKSGKKIKDIKKRIKHLQSYNIKYKSLKFF